MQNKVMYLVREDEFVDGNSAGAERIGEARRLLIGDIGIVIAVNE